MEGRLLNGLCFLSPRLQHPRLLEHGQFAKAWEMLATQRYTRSVGANGCRGQSPGMTPPVSLYCNAAATLLAPGFKAKLRAAGMINRLLTSCELSV